MGSLEASVWSGWDDPRLLPTLLVVGLTLGAVLVHLFFFASSGDESAVEFGWESPPEAASTWRGHVLSHPSIDPVISDAPAPASSSTHSLKDHIVCYDPATGYHLGTFPATLPSEIDVMVQSAADAQTRWAKTTMAQRRRVLRSLLDWVVDDAEAICRVAARDTGKMMIDASFGEILTTAEKLRWCIANAEKTLRPETRPTNLLLAHKRSTVRYEPLGVVAAIISWNYPFHSLMSTVIAALITGNAIIVKPSELVLWSSTHYLDAIHSCLSACGFHYGEDLVQLAACLSDGSAHLSSAKGVGHITFIGSDVVGKKVAEQAARGLIPVTMELGGKDPAVILPDADIDYFVDVFMRAAFQAAGQNCIGIERFLVADSIYARFVTLVEPRVAALTTGPPLLPSPHTRRLDVGAMVSDRQFPNLRRLIDDAVAQGARVLVGGKQAVDEEFPSGHYWQPALIVDVTPDMEIANQEVFAPMMLVMRYSNIDDAVRLANSTRYALGAAVFGRSRQLCRSVASRLRCGMVAINDFAVFYMNQGVPFGGTAGSGYGRIAGPEGLRALCNVKTVTEDRLHGLVQTSIPEPVAYPITAGGGQGWRFVEGLVELAYSSRWRDRIGGLRKLVG